ncbi:MAG: quinolinate synthase NadA [Desulfobacter sp.]|nr:quinolinate synthase NadA [Desulfobacter sp.]
MNSHAGVKALCGRNQGAVCSSSNALKTFEWALEKKEKIFFFPDEHLRRNTAAALNLPEAEILVWDPANPLGGNSESALLTAKIILWKGSYLVHARFSPKQVQNMRKNFPEAGIVVHPECPHEVVKEADACGSTSFIVRYVTDAIPGATIVVGTEINLIKRLAAEHPDKKILPLNDSFCPHMHKINLKNLRHTMRHIGKANVVTLDEKIKTEALIALQNMLNL